MLSFGNTSRNIIIFRTPRKNLECATNVQGAPSAIERNDMFDCVVVGLVTGT